MRNDYTDYKMITQIFWACLVILILQAHVAAQGDIELSREQRIERAQEYYSAGKECIRRGDYPAADEEFKKAQQLLGASPPVESPAVIVNEVKPPAVKTTNEIKSAVPVKAKEAKILPPRESSNLAAKANELDQKGQLEEASSLYLKAIALEPKDPNLYYNLAVENLKINQYALAEQAFKQAIKLNPKDKDAYYNLGVLYESYLIDKAEAVNCYTKYLKLATRAEDAGKVQAWVRQINQEMGRK